MGHTILVVEDDALMRSFLVDVLAAEGHRVESASDGAAGLARLEREAWDLVITDLKMPGLDGLALLREGRKIRPEARWIVVTAHGSIESAVEAMKAGATDYLLKPFKNPDELRLVVRRALREVERETRIALLSEELGRDFPPSELIFLGAAMERLRDMVREVAPTTANVLLTGASGTGKEVLARVVHAWSPRHDQPFVAVNCAALAESLLESELFGHERGAFTGAVAARKGRFELADGGTLLLDEVGEIAPAVQVKLLRVLQERVIERVGGVRPVPVDVRVVAATNRDLKALVAAGTFREDLYYRLNVFTLPLPPLRDRKPDIPLLAQHFIHLCNAKHHAEVEGLRDGTLELLMRYPWPGNVRELKNTIERAVVLAKGKWIELAHLPVYFLEPAAGLSAAASVTPGATIAEIEKQMILKTLEATGNNKAEAARQLGLDVKTIRNKLKAYGIG
jgi:two-component system response regulator HydG